MAYHVRIDHLTQGSEGQQIPVDRLSVNSEDFLWIFVEAELLSDKSPKGEYYEIIDDKNESKVELDEPKLIKNQYRFSVIHNVLSKKSKYLFHFADILNKPEYEDQWEVRTI